MLGSENLAKRLHSALFSDTVNEEEIKNVIISTNNEQRLSIREKYKKLYGYPIQKDINEKLNNKFKDISLALFDSPFEFDAREINKALHSFLVDYKVLIEIFVTRPKSYLEIISQVYQKFFKISLKEDLKGEANKEFALYVMAIIDTPRPESRTINIQKAYDIAKLIKNKGLEDYGKNVDLFKSLFIEKSREDLILICRAYYELFHKSLYEKIKDEMSGKVRRLVKNLLFATISPSEWMSKKLYSALEGFSTDFNRIIRILVSREKIDMDEINSFYYFFKEEDLLKTIKDEDLGLCGDILINLAKIKKNNLIR